MTINESIRDVLLSKNLVDEEKLTICFNNAETDKTSLLDEVLNDELIDSTTLAKLVADLAGLEYADINVFEIDDNLVKRVPINFIKNTGIIPISFNESKTKILVVISDLERLKDVGLLRYYFDQEFDIRFTSNKATRRIIEYIDNKFRKSSAIVNLNKEFESETTKKKDDDVSINDVVNGPAVQLVDSMLREAVATKASDVHIEPFEQEVKVRFRVDGTLIENSKIPNYLYSAVLARFKILANLDISERRTPQDGKLSLTIENNKYDFRISTLPVIYGEKIVIRIYDGGDDALDLEDIGFNEQQREVITKMISNPYGILLVTGPTGSGKTTTLYSFLKYLNKPTRNIMTIEDPVENEIEGINQIQVNPKVNLTFASALRSILRQDPNIIMLGEIRDEETAQIAVKSAITGHLVFSTVHTNDAPGTIVRLVDMGIPEYLVADAVIGAISQRLVRRLCPHCKKPHKTTREETKKLGLSRAVMVYEPCGCPSCNHTGYRGRTATFEILSMNNKIRDAINSKDFTSEKLRQVCKEEGLKTILEDCKELVLNGTTSVEEYSSLVDFTLIEQTQTKKRATKRKTKKKKTTKKTKTKVTETEVSATETNDDTTSEVTTELDSNIIE